MGAKISLTAAERRKLGIEPKKPRKPRKKGPVDPWARATSLEQAFRQLLEMSRNTETPIPEGVFQHRWNDSRSTFDFAWTQQKVAVELQGGITQRMRTGHTSVSGLQRDYDKLNRAQVSGWLVLQFSAIDMERTPSQVLETLHLAILSRSGG